MLEAIEKVRSLRIPASASGRRDHEHYNRTALAAAYPGTDPEGRNASPILVQEADIESPRNVDFTPAIMSGSMSGSKVLILKNLANV